MVKKPVKKGRTAFRSAACCWTLEGDLKKSDKDDLLSDLQYTTDLYRQYNT